MRNIEIGLLQSKSLEWLSSSIDQEIHPAKIQAEKILQEKPNDMGIKLNNIQDLRLLPNLKGCSIA